MDKSQSEDRVIITDDNDVLVLPGSNNLILFISAAHVTSLHSPESVSALIITDVGAAAILAAVAANATIKSSVTMTKSGAIQTATLMFMLPNGIMLAYTTDEALATDRTQLNSLGIDLVVTNSWVDWRRKQTVLVGEIIAKVPSVPAQVTSLRNFDSQHIARIIDEALAKRRKEETP